MRAFDGVAPSMRRTAVVVRQGAASRQGYRLVDHEAVRVGRTQRVVDGPIADVAVGVAMCNKHI